MVFAVAGSFRSLGARESRPGLFVKMIVFPCPDHQVHSLSPYFVFPVILDPDDIPFRASSTCTHSRPVDLYGIFRHKLIRCRTAIAINGKPETPIPEFQVMVFVDKLSSFGFQICDFVQNPLFVFYAGVLGKYLRC